MKKYDLKLPRETWKQLKSKYPADSELVQDDDFTTGTKNIDTTAKGVITKRKGSVPYNPSSLASAPKDQYEAIFEDGIRHLLAVQSGEVKYSTGDGVFNTVVNGSGFSSAANFEFATINNRIYGDNGVNPPQVYDRATGYGGVAYTAPQMAQMGAQAPTTALTLQSQSSPGGVPESAIGYRYKVTFVYYDNEESNGGPESAVITVPAGGADNTLENIPVGGYGVTARNIYRTIDGFDDYLSVGTINNNTDTVFVDDQPAGVIAIPLNHDVPPVFAGITVYQEAAWIYGIVGEPFTLRFSNKGLPDIMPQKNFIICNQQDPIVAAVVFKGRLIVFNRNSMGQVLGTNFFNYQYQDIQGSVGCVDPRSVQVRTIQGIPTLIWLSDKGFYSYNGNSVDYMSDAIEDLINFNIQQAQFNKGKQEFSSDAEFNGLVKSDAIVVSGGQMTTINPKQNYSTQTDWDGGSAVEDIATSQGDGTIKTIPQADINTNAANAQNQGTINVGGVIQLPTVGLEPTAKSLSLTGSGARATHLIGGGEDKWAQPIRFNFSGTITSMTNYLQDDRTRFPGGFPNFLPFQYRISIFNDIGNTPGGELVGTTVDIGGPANPAIYQTTWNPNFHVTASTQYWIVIDYLGQPTAPGAPNSSIISFPVREGSSGDPNLGSAKCLVDGVWQNPVSGGVGRIFLGPGAGNAVVTLPFDYNFTQDINAANGTWISDEFDTESIYVTKQISYTHNVTKNNTLSGVPVTNTVKIQGSNTEISPRVFVDVHNFGDIGSGVHNFTPSTEYRYWRVVVEMTTPDNRNGGAGTEGTPLFTGGTLAFSDTGTWESQPIFTSDDIISFDSLTHNSSLPAQVVLEIATAPASGGPYTAYVPIGSAVPDRYAKIRATLTSIGSQYPSLGEIELTWSVEATAEVNDASPIDTTLNNAGWNIFLTDQDLNGGTLAYEMKSASSIPGIPGATFFSVTPLSFPSGVPVNKYTKWKVTISSSADSVPVIRAVIPQWYLGTSDSIRTASLFYNRSYYLAAAKFGSTTNNILIVLDGENRWRVYEDINVNTLGLFFNDPFFGSADEGVFYKFLEGDIDKNADNIAMDLRTRAFDFGQRDPAASDKIKLIKQVEVRFKNTGATYQVWYSVDEGQNFYLMYTDDDQDSYTTPENDGITPVRFRVDYNAGNPIAGRTIMIRVTNDDEKPAQIHNIRFKGFIREADVINIAQ